MTVDELKDRIENEYRVFKKKLLTPDSSTLKMVFDFALEIHLKRNIFLFVYFSTMGSDMGEKLAELINFEKIQKINLLNFLYMDILHNSAEPYSVNKDQQFLDIYGALKRLEAIDETPV